MKNKFYAAVLAMQLFGCASVPKHLYAPNLPIEASQGCDDIAGYSSSQQAKDVACRFGTKCQFHVLAANPKFVTNRLSESRLESDTRATDISDLPLFLVGMEKPRNTKAIAHCIDENNQEPSKQCFAIGNAGTEPGYNAESSARVRQTIKTELNDSRPSVLTHIASFTGFERNTFAEPCFIFNAYSQGKLCSGASVASGDDPAGLLLETENALRQLNLSIRYTVKSYKPTHVFVLSTGWNTYEFEELYNYRDWVRELLGAANNSETGVKDFRPMFIATAWESTWTKIPKVLSAITKGNDADEVGYSWMNKVLNEVILPATKDENLSLKVILVGHSYGTRVLGSALYARSLLAHRGYLSKSLPDAFIGLQSAFPIKRLLFEGKEPTWAHFNSLETRVTLFASVHDQSTSYWFLPTYAGGAQAIAYASSSPKASWISFQEANHNGTNLGSGMAKKVRLIDASAFVNRQMPGTGGGAHSDVFDRQMANAIIQVVRGL
jgi:hypothetical protein